MQYLFAVLVFEFMKIGRMTVTEGGFIGVW
jgi:hypothetical protein